MGRPTGPRSALRLGCTDSASAGARVAELQASLRRLQVLQPGEPVTAGCFDEPTERALRNFQWFAGHVPGAVSADGAFVERAPVRMAVDGVAGRSTRALIQTFVANDWAATGLLVQFSFGLLQRLQPNLGFRALLDGNRCVGVCESGFAGVLRAMDAAAGRFGVDVFVNELFRAEGNPASGDVPAPASFSAHRLGRAVDLQLGVRTGAAANSIPQASVDLMTAAPRTPLARFRQHAKQALRCRYGGDFDPVDPPHFDRQILPGGSANWRMHYFFNQLQYRQALRNPHAIPEVKWDASPR